MPPTGASDATPAALLTGDLDHALRQGIGKCTEICYKYPVLEDRQWSAYIDRSPGEDNYSLISSNN